VDGIKPTLSDLNDDQTPVYDPVKVDLLHPNGPANVDPSIPQEAARVAPITPPLHSVPESNVEFVRNPAPPASEPSAEAKTPVPDRVQQPAAPILDRAPVGATAAVDTSKAAAVGTSGAPFMAPANKRGGKGLLIVVIVLLLVVGAGAAYYFLVYKKAPVATAPASIALTAATPTSLGQRTTNGSLSEGATSSTPPTLTATLATKATTGEAKLQVEVEPLGTAFTGTPTDTGSAVTANGSDLSLTDTLKTLPVGSYHWQARTEVGSSFSSWVPKTTGTTADFIIAAAVAPATPAVTAIGGGGVSGTSLTSSQNEPALSGTTAAGTTLTIVVTPDNITLTPTVSSSGTWTVTPTQQLSNGTHTLTLTATDGTGNHSQASYSLNINPVATVPATPNVATTTPATSTPSSGSSSSSSAASTPATAQATTPAPGNLAATGDATQPLTLIALVVGLSAAAGLVYLRYDDRRHQDDQG
jgi:hypothetical protein